jgi:hypothetical protein
MLGLTSNEARSVVKTGLTAVVVTDINHVLTAKRG